MKIKQMLSIAFLISFVLFETFYKRVPAIAISFWLFHHLLYNFAILIPVIEIWWFNDTDV